MNNDYWSREEEPKKMDTQTVIFLTIWATVFVLALFGVIGGSGGCAVPSGC